MDKTLRGKNRSLQLVRYVGDELPSKCFELFEFIYLLLLKLSEGIDLFVDGAKRIQRSGSLLAQIRKLLLAELGNQCMNSVDLAKDEKLKEKKYQQIGNGEADNKRGREHRGGCRAEERKPESGDQCDAKRQQQGQYPRAVQHAYVRLNLYPTPFTVVMKSSPIFSRTLRICTSTVRAR